MHLAGIEVDYLLLREELAGGHLGECQLRFGILQFQFNDIETITSIQMRAHTYKISSINSIQFIDAETTNSIKKNFITGQLTMVAHLNDQVQFNFTI